VTGPRSTPAARAQLADSLPDLVHDLPGTGPIAAPPRIQADAVRSACMYFGSTDLCALIETMPIDDTIALGDFRDWNQGKLSAFVVFQQPVGLGRIGIVYFAPMIGGPAAVNPRDVTGLGGWVRYWPIGEPAASWCQYALPVDPVIDDSGLNRIHWSDDAIDDDPDRNQIRGSIAQAVCAVVALLPQAGLFTTTTVTVDAAGAHSSDPATRRAARRQQSDTVRVIDLRAPVKRDLDAVDHAERTYQHRWIVRGHWRNQAHGTQRQQRKRIFIAPHVKGDPDHPLLTDEPVYRW
jgi:hypothetical protein